MALTIAVTVIAVTVATYNLWRLYGYEKEQLLADVQKCAENAILLEMISQMQSGEDAKESFVRLNSLIEMMQQKNGRLAQADTLRVSLASILKFGLEFKNSRWKPDYHKLDSMFMAEMQRLHLRAKAGYIRKGDMDISGNNGFWKTGYGISPGSPVEYDVYVSPLYMDILSHMWGIVIPFLLLIVSFSFLSVYLTRIIKKLRTLEQMKDDFTHNMTHELKTPVAVAYSAADSMLRYYDQSDETRNRKLLKIIMQRLGFLSGMIENILSLSMERFKSMNLRIEAMGIKQIVEEVAGMIELKADKPVTIDIKIDDNVSVMGDALHFGNVLSNLLDNAVKYSGDSVRIIIKADNRSIEIADNGIGIEKGKLPYIFDKFYRVNSGDMYEAGGYGLGLFYVKQIIELHGWSIEVESKQGNGTKFTIKFIGNEKG